MKVVRAAPLLPRSSFSTWTSSSWPSLIASLMRAWDAPTRLGRSTLGDFLERQEAVAVFAVVDEAGFERGLDPRHDGLVDVALALFAPFDFDFVVEEFLSVDDRQPAFFRLRGVDQHPLHMRCPCSVDRSTRAHDGPIDAGRRFETEGIAAGAGCCGPLRERELAASSVSSEAGGVGARGWARARCGVDWLSGVAAAGAQWRAAGGDAMPAGAGCEPAPAGHELNRTSTQECLALIRRSWSSARTGIPYRCFEAPA